GRAPEPEPRAGAGRPRAAMAVARGRDRLVAERDARERHVTGGGGEHEVTRRLTGEDAREVGGELPLVLDALGPRGAPARVADRGRDARERARHESGAGRVALHGDREGLVGQGTVELAQRPA